MLLLTVTRSELLDAWQRSIPPDAPNRFAINIQPDQREAVAELLSAGGIDAELQPMVRARLMRIGERPVSAASYPEDERAQRLVEREFNLSWRASLPEDNRVVAGQWFKPEEAGQGLASVEEGLARTLGIHVGDELVFNVAGDEKALRVTSLRKLDWDSMRVNFFVIAPPGVIDRAPASYITSFHVPADGEKAASELVKRFPNLTLIDIGQILHQMRQLIGQVVGAVQFIFVFTLLAGAVVLYAALLSAFDERRYELAVMRALGALRGQLRSALLIELAVTGAIAGALAGAGAGILGMIVARKAFELELAANFWLPPLSAAAGALLATAVGWVAIRRLLNTPPLLALRAGG